MNANLARKHLHLLKASNIMKELIQVKNHMNAKPVAKVFKVAKPEKA